MTNFESGHGYIKDMAGNIIRVALKSEEDRRSGGSGGVAHPAANVPAIAVPEGATAESVAIVLNDVLAALTAAGLMVSGEEPA
jgi:hypothetical protein